MVRFSHRCLQNKTVKQAASVFLIVERGVILELFGDTCILSTVYWNSHGGHNFSPSVLARLLLANSSPWETPWRAYCSSSLAPVSELAPIMRIACLLTSLASALLVVTNSLPCPCTLYSPPCPCLFVPTYEPPPRLYQDISEKHSLLSSRGTKGWMPLWQLFFPKAHFSLPSLHSSSGAFTQCCNQPTAILARQVGC